MILHAVGVFLTSCADNGFNFSVVIEDCDSALRLNGARELAPVFGIVACFVLEYCLRLVLKIHIDVGVDIEAAVVHLESCFAFGKTVALLQILHHVGKYLFCVPAPVLSDGILIFRGEIKP